MVVAVLDRSTADPFPHPGFCLFAKFYDTEWSMGGGQGVHNKNLGIE